MRKVPPEWGVPLKVLRSLLAQAFEGKRVAHPTVLAELAKLPLPDTIAYLGFLEDSGDGQFRFRVVDANGLEVQRFGTLTEIPPSVENEFGDVIPVTPENTELVFVSK